jgi:hypothetical protein
MNAQMACARSGTHAAEQITSRIVIMMNPMYWMVLRPMRSMVATVMK